MTTVTSADFQKNFGTYKREALNNPVRIFIHGKETLVLMSKAQYDKLIAKNDTDAPARNIPTPQKQREVASRRPDLTPEDVARIRDMLMSANGVKFNEKPA